MISDEDRRFSAAGLADLGYSGRIEARWRKYPNEARSLYEEAIVPREAVYSLFRSHLLSRFANVRMIADAAGCSSTKAGPKIVAGAQWEIAEIEPKHSAITFAASRLRDPQYQKRDPGPRSSQIRHRN
jgi:hypothetical protein